MLVRSPLIPLLFAGWVSAADIPWNLDQLSSPPKTCDASAFATNGIRAVFFDGLPWKGKPTRVFAYIGIPDHQPGEKVPGMVLVHGGGGTAFAEWVKLWNSRGYAAIAMDTCGCTPGGTHGKRPRHEHGGPAGWGGFDQIDEPMEDQWPYHAVADVILAHSLLRSLPEVDPHRIGLTGISWGGYLTCIVAGVDNRFRFAVPVYGCGFLGDNSTWLPQFKKMGAAKATKWLKLWDPSNYLPRARMPFLWVSGSNDFAYPMDSLQKSYRLTPGPHTLCLRVRMPHGHGGPGEKPEEIRVFADHVLKGGPPLARITTNNSFESVIPIVKAELNYTKDTGAWKERRWETIPAHLASNRFTAAIPPDATVWYFNLTDERGCVVSTEHIVATLTLSRSNNFLVVHGPHGKIPINYLEAYCRANSADADWVKHTVIPHKTELLSLSDDRKVMKLRDTLEDGVTVEHTITAKDDEVDFRLTAHNPTTTRSEAHWAQPCPRLDEFTGCSGPDRNDYLPKCFLFLDGKLARMPTPQWATQARYIPGQVWCPAHVPRTDVNPRPLNPLVPSNGLIGCFSADEKTIFATAWEPYQELFQGVARCLHADFRLGGLSPGETKHIRGKIYIVPADVNALLKRYHADFPRREPLLLKTSGTPEQPAVFDGQGMVIDLGTDVTDHPWKKNGDLWTSNGPLLQRAPVPAGQVAGLFIEELPIAIPRDLAAERLHPERKTRCYVAPDALKPGQMGYAADGSLYFRWPTGKTPGRARVILPATAGVSCVTIAASNIIVRNITAKYAGNDGFNIHGKWTGIRIENVRALCNADEGISAHDDVEMAVDGAEIAWNGSNSGGAADVDRSVTRYRNCTVHDNPAAAFHFSGTAHTVTDTLIYNQTRDFVGPTKPTRERVEWRK